MNTIIELEGKISETSSDIEDILHAASLNFKALMSEVQQPDVNTLHDQFRYLDNLLRNIRKLVEERTPVFMSYLIIKQIQDQEGRVRRERLVQYQEKIYDQKRIISDKETCFQQLQRPRRKRPAFQTPEEFQQIRARERQAEQRMKTQQLHRQITELNTVRKMLIQQDKSKKRTDLEHTKSSSISQVSFSAGEAAEILTDRVTPLDQRKNRASHFRATSVQHQFGKDFFFAKKQDSEEDYQNARKIISEIKTMRICNEEKHNIYDASVQSLKFKKNQNIKKQEAYKLKNAEWKDIRQQLGEVKKQEEWTLNRVGSPITCEKRSLSP